MTKDDRRLAQELNRVREADAKHEVKMKVICARGRKTLHQVRAMGMGHKDRFISDHVIPGEYDRT